MPGTGESEDPSLTANIIIFELTQTI